MFGTATRGAADRRVVVAAAFALSLCATAHGGPPTRTRCARKGDEGQPVGCIEGLVSGPRRLTDRRRAPKVVRVATTLTRRATGARNASGQAPATPAVRGADQKPSGHDASAPYPLAVDPIHVRQYGLLEDWGCDPPSPQGARCDCTVTLA